MRIFATSRPTARFTPAAAEATMADELAHGRDFYREGLIVQAYIDPGYERTYMILETGSVAAAKARFDTYPQVREGLIEFEYTPLIGMPAVAKVHAEDETPLPARWPVRVK